MPSLGSMICQFDTVSLRFRSFNDTTFIELSGGSISFQFLYSFLILLLMLWKQLINFICVRTIQFTAPVQCCRAIFVFSPPVPKTNSL